MLKQRVITALWGLPILFAIVWFGEPWFTILVLAWSILAILEFFRLLAGVHEHPQVYCGVIWTILFIISRNAMLQAQSQPFLEPGFVSSLLLTSAVVIPLICLLFRRNRERAFAGWAWTIAGIIYIGWLLGHLVALRDLDAGRNWVLFMFAVTFVSDSTAYFVGRAWGKHYLARSVSPNKTREGSIGALVAAVIIAILFALPTPFHLPISYSTAAILGLAVSVFGQLGDLVKSIFKRNMGVKDSGKLIPGHGGVLDRSDSILFATAVVYFYAILF